MNFPFGTNGKVTILGVPILKHIRVNGAKKPILGQNPHEVSDSDQISPRFLKEMTSLIALTLIYQASYEQGQIPDDWKRAFVTPLFKEGDKSKAANYRPISLTYCCCKVMEYIA